MSKSINLKYWLVAIIFLNMAFSLNAYAVKFYSINTLFGISMREANSVCEDDNGFVWASSKTGILRFSGDSYQTYQLPYESANVITVKLIYKYSTLIAYSNNGQIFVFDPVYNRFDLLLNLSKHLNNDYLGVYNLLVDDSGAYWIASTSGLYKYHSGELQIIDQSITEGALMTWFDKQNFLLVKPDGIWLFDTHSNKSKCICENRSIDQISVSSLLLDKDKKKLWIGTISKGLLCYDFNKKSLSNLFKSSLLSQPILAIEANTDSTLLIGYDGQGIWEVNKNKELVKNIYKESDDDPTSLSGNGVYDLYCDKNKRVWVCTFSGGLSYFDQTSAKVNQIVHHANDVNSLINDNVNCVIEDHWGKMWFATNNGISCWDIASNKWKSFYNNQRQQSQVFLSLCEDDKGQIWAGSYSSGVYLLDGKTGRELAHYSRDVKGSPQLCDFILNIFKDSQGDIWLGGVGGPLACYMQKENDFRVYSKDPINAFAELSNDQIFLGCTYGLSVLNRQKGDVKILLLGILVQDILIRDEDAWICTGGDGLIRYNYKSKTTEKFTTQNGLPSNFINSIVYVDGYFWLGTETGLCRFNPEDKTVLTFSSTYPLASISYNRASCFQMRNGQLAWGTNKGAVIFSPESIKEVPLKGRIFFQDLMVSGRSIRDIASFDLKMPVDSLQTVNLKHHQNTISLELLPIGISGGSKFSWKMDGLDHEWTTPTDNRIVTYTNIPSGKFTLRIRRYNSSLTSVISERTLAIKLVPPFWRTAWFWIGVAIAILGIFFLYLLYYINRLKQEHTEEKIRFFTNTAHDIRTSLTLIKAPVEELNKEKGLTESGKYYLNLAMEQSRRLSSVVTQLMDFQKVDMDKEQLVLSMTDIVKLVSNRKVMAYSYAKSRNIELVFMCDCASYISAVDGEKMEKVIDNLISNAIKYSPDNSQIHIELKCDDKKWELQVKDNGIGISRKAQSQLFKEFYRGDNAINSKVVGSGIGLLLVKNYVGMHGGQISFTSQENVGSTFQVVIPYKSISGEAVTANALSELQPDSPDINRIIPQPEPVDETTASKEMKVLLVEDNDDLLNFMKHALGDDFKIFTAIDGKDAWEFISGQIPDLVVSDIMMPNMDGFELCKLIKSTYETSHVPIILLTALSEKTDQLHGLGLGADDYLTKPFDINLLVQRIKSIIRNREIIREKALKLIKGDSNEHILTNEHNDKFVKKMSEVVWTNIANTKFDKDEFASAMNVSSSLLYKKVKALTNQSPTDFIKTVRLNYAVELLQSGKYTVTEISELCGFASLTYFGVVFKKHFGKSPSEIIE